MFQTHRTREICDALCNGQFDLARYRLFRGVKTKPDALAIRAGAVVGSLCDPENYNRPELAERFLSYLYEEV